MLDPQAITNIANSMSSLVAMDKEVDKFYQLLKDKDIEPKTIADLERVIRFFDDTIKVVTEEIMKDEAITKDLKDFVIARFTLDMYGKLSETFNLPFELVPSGLGSHNQNKFNQSIKEV